MLGVSRDGDVVVLELQREERRNALTTDLCRALEAAVRDAVAEEPAAGGARAVVLTGRGTAFCSGADLDGVHGDDFLAAHESALRAVATAPVPVVAAVNGPAVGGGCQLALACDLRVAGPTASFAVPTARNGLAIDPLTISRLADLAGLGVARRMLLAAETIDHDEALARGLADRSGSVADALAWAREIATFAPLSLRHAKLVLGGRADGEAHGPEHADALQTSFRAVWSSADALEAATARLERRAPTFRGV